MIAPDEIVLRAFLVERLSLTSCVEVMAVLHGIKRVARFTGRVKELAALMELLRLTGLRGKIAPVRMERIFGTGLSDTFCRVVPDTAGDDDESVLLVGEERAVDSAVDHEMNGDSAVEAAELYGYPACCARNYEQKIQHGHHWVSSFLSGLQGLARAPWHMNRFGRLFAPYVSLLPDFFPCHISCTASMALAREYADMLKQRGLSLLLESLKTCLLRPVLRHEGCLYLLELLPDSRFDAESAAVRVLSSIAYAGEPLSDTTLILHNLDGQLRINDHEDDGTNFEETVCVIFSQDAHEYPL
jgi:hypothetical protein